MAPPRRLEHRARNPAKTAPIDKAPMGADRQRPVPRGTANPVGCPADDALSAAAILA